MPFRISRRFPAQTHSRNRATPVTLRVRSGYRGVYRLATVAIVIGMAGSPLRPSWSQEPAPAASNAEPATAAQPAAAESAAPVEFNTQVRPILQRHCYECHNSLIVEGGLRLDDKRDALVGGNSERPILGGTLETNELYRRVASDDPSERMPLHKPPLTPVEIETIRRWVEQGTPWPDPPAPKISPRARAAVSAQPGSDSTAGLDELPVWTELVLAELNRSETLQKLLFAAAAIVLAIAAIEAPRSWYRRGVPWTQGRAEPAFRTFSKIRAPYYLLALVFAAATALGLFSINTVEDAYRTRHQQKLKDEKYRQQQLQNHVVELQDRIRRSGKEIPGRIDLNTVYGTPPIPFRPNHARRIRGTYYRGNCERNDKLFNYGNYLTATFHIGLCDETGRMLELGDPSPPGGLYMKCELVRAPKTAPALYSTKIMDAVFLSRAVLAGKKRADVSDAVPLEILESDWHWVAYFPLGQPEAGKQALAGLIYVYSNTTMHYGIKYDLVLEDGRVVEGSDVWMNNLMLPGRVAYPQPGKIPLAEWFDDRPLPVIVGENTTDPKLLGVYDYLPEEKKSGADEEASQAPKDQQQPGASGQPAAATPN